MNDPHVESLRYNLEVDETCGRFEGPPPLVHTTQAYILNLESNILSVEMKEHYASEDSARARVEADLKAWEMHVALQRDKYWFRFVFDPKGTVIVDRNPPPLAPGEVRGEGHVVVGQTIVAGVGRVIPPSFKQYPDPPKAFEASFEVEVLFERYLKAVWLDESQLLSVGYVCLSFLEGTTGVTQGARREVARKYRIAQNVRDKFGDLVSDKGDIRDARKLSGGSNQAPLTQNERLWVRAAIKAFIRRKAEYDYDPAAASSLPEITMADLPNL